MLTVEKILLRLSQAPDSIAKEQKEKYEKLCAEAKECCERNATRQEIAIAEYRAKTDEVKKEKEFWESKNKTLQRQREELEQKELELEKRANELEEMRMKCEALRGEYESKMSQNRNEVVVLQQTIERLREENCSLERANGEQRRNAEKLKLNARLLSSELSAARHQRKTLATGARPKNISFSGEGEQGNGVCLILVRYVQIYNLTFGCICKYKYATFFVATDLSAPLLIPQPHHLMGRKQHNNFYCSSSDEAQNIDVLEETRERLQRLQKENDRIDRKINTSFRNKHAHTKTKQNVFFFCNGGLFQISK